QNSYLFGNCFTASDILPYLTTSSVLDNQKGVSVRGTFLQNVRYMDVFYREGYTIVEMEAGPYLSAIYEMVRAQRHPVNEIVNLYIAPFDVGFLHYASDTPMSKGRNLGAGRLSYLGAEPTYATAIATLRRIFSVELARLREQPSRAELRTENVSRDDEGAGNGSLSGDSDQPVGAPVRRSRGRSCRHRADFARRTAVRLCQELAAVAVHRRDRPRNAAQAERVRSVVRASGGCSVRRGADRRRLARPAIALAAVRPGTRRAEHDPRRVGAWDRIVHGDNLRDGSRPLAAQHPGGARGSLGDLVRLSCAGSRPTQSPPAPQRAQVARRGGAVGEV